MVMVSEGGVEELVEKLNGVAETEQGYACLTDGACVEEAERVLLGVKEVGILLW